MSKQSLFYFIFNKKILIQVLEKIEFWSSDKKSIKKLEKSNVKILFKRYLHRFLFEKLINVKGFKGMNKHI